jgi:hypothetical protein
VDVEVKSVDSLYRAVMFVEVSYGEYRGFQY